MVKVWRSGCVTKLCFFGTKLLGGASIVAALAIIPGYVHRIVPVSQARSLSSSQGLSSSVVPAARWTATVPALLSHALGNGSSSLTSVSCESPTFCVAVGDFTDLASQQQGLMRYIQTWAKSREISSRLML